MIKLVVHSPKGGVGKTTLATSIATFLARHGKRVWAWDLAQFSLMTRFLGELPEFSVNQTPNKIHTEELAELPVRFPGASKFDYLVADTDDYDKTQGGLLGETGIGWRVIVPIDPGDKNGLIRIPESTAKLVLGALLYNKQTQPKIHIVMNMTRCGYVYHTCHEAVCAALDKARLLPVFSKVWVPNAEGKYHPDYIQDPNFSDAIERLLKSIEA